MHEICLIPNNNLLIWVKKKSGAQALSKQAKKKNL
jgi:hypothetical protein